jgi:polyisoprenoid-binding protein YceI
MVASANSVTLLCRRALLCLALGAAALPAQAQTTYVLDQTRSKIAFSISHFVVSSTAGAFATFDGKLDVPPGTPEQGAVTIHVATASISTGIDARDAHLRSADFFDSDKFPQMIFQSSALVLTGASTGKLTGLLTLHGVTRPLSLDVTLRTPDRGAPRLAFAATGTLKRSDFGMTSFPGVIGDEVSLSITATFTRAVK